MPERKTIVLDDEVIKKIRNKQAKKIKDTASAVSFSSIVNEMLSECMKNS